MRIKTASGTEHRFDSAWTAARKTRFFNVPAGLTVWLPIGDSITVPLETDTPEARQAAFTEAGRRVCAMYGPGTEVMR